ncbi:MAG: hypothetical protein ACR2PA_23430 [Hyphomicrobiaceae bacterium]
MTPWRWVAGGSSGRIELILTCSSQAHAILWFSRGRMPSGVKKEIFLFVPFGSTEGAYSQDDDAQSAAGVGVA